MWRWCTLVSIAAGVHLAGITLRLRYRAEPVNAVWGNSRCLLWEPYGTHKYTLWAECRGFVYKNPVRISQDTYYISATETSRLMLFGETVAVYCWEPYVIVFVIVIVFTLCSVPFTACVVCILRFVWVWCVILCDVCYCSITATG
jgi:hypothetical protein